MSQRQGICLNVWNPWTKHFSKMMLGRKKLTVRSLNTMNPRRFQSMEVWSWRLLDDTHIWWFLSVSCGPVDYFTIKSQIARNAQTFPKDSQPSALGDGSQLLSPTRATKHHPKTKAAWHGWHSMTTCTKTSKRGLLLVCPRNILIVYSYGDLGGIWRCLVRGNMYIYIRIYSYSKEV